MLDAMLQDVWRKFFRFESEFGIYTDSEFKDQLISLIKNSISEAREKHRLWALYGPIQWYIWCAENHPELGFLPCIFLSVGAPPRALLGCVKNGGTLVYDLFFVASVKNQSQ